MRRGWPVFVLLSLWACGIEAGIYRYTDAQGQVHYTNHPPPSSQATELELAPAPTTSFETQSPRQSSSAPTPEAQQNTGYSLIHISGVENGAALRLNNGNLEVEVSTEPRLHPAHSIQLLLDGAPVSTPSAGGRFSLSNLDRGSHTLQAEVLDAQGRSLQRGATVGFSLQRTSLNSPARRAAP